MKFIINCILLILIAHIMLKNLSFNNNYSQPLQNEKNIRIHNIIQSRNLNQLPQQLHRPIQQREIDIQGSNYYTHDNNTPNFKSNIVETPRYYTYNEEGSSRGGPYYEHFSNEKKEQVQNNEENKENKENKKEVSDNSAVSSMKTDENKTVENFGTEGFGVAGGGNWGLNDEDSWQYKNELAMNGGNLGIRGMNVYGSQSLNTAFAPIGMTNTVLSGCDPYESSNKKDDIRFGMGLPNEINMKGR